VTYQRHKPRSARPRKPLSVKAVAGIVTTAVILGCCGLSSIGAMLDDSSSKPEKLSVSAPAANGAVGDGTKRGALSGDESTATVTPATAASPTPAVSAAPSRTPARTVKPTVRPTKRATSKPTTSRPKPRPTRTTSAPSRNVVHPGSYCSTAGARGVTKTGKPMVCKRTATDPKLRWRAA
jgi:hypothetical protein